MPKLKRMVKTEEEVALQWVWKADHDIPSSAITVG